MTPERIERAAQRLNMRFCERCDSPHDRSGLGHALKVGIVTLAFERYANMLFQCKHIAYVRS